MAKTKHVAAERAAWLKHRAQELGFTSVGISMARELTEEAPRLEAWLKQGMHGEMSYMEGNFDKRLDPQKLLPGTRSVVSSLFNYHNPDRAQDSEAPRIAQYAYGGLPLVLKWKLKGYSSGCAEWGDVGGRVYVGRRNSGTGGALRAWVDWQA